MAEAMLALLARSLGMSREGDHTTWKGEHMSLETVVRDRYSHAALTPEVGLCCPVDYDPRFLEVIPEEVLSRDYGCGDPVSHVREGETVLDLGSGSGKVCFIAAQITGPRGRVIGVDLNDEMLALARSAQPTVAERLGYDNVEFVKGRIEDLQLDSELVSRRLGEQPVASYEDLQRLEVHLQHLRRHDTLIPNGSIDVVISNCVLNLVSTDAKQRMFRELHRVLKPAGRAVISDIVCDETVPLHLQDDPDLWSGCYSGAMREDEFIDAFAKAGFYGINIVKRDSGAWRVIEGIEFRSMTVVAYKGKEGPCWDYKQAVVYRGPFSRVEDDDGHIYVRGARAAVCQKTFAILTRAPYAEHFESVDPALPVAPGQAQPFPCGEPFYARDPRETKGIATARLLAGSNTSAAPRPVSGPSGGCC